jgi:hypothetical protein
MRLVISTGAGKGSTDGTDRTAASPAWLQELTEATEPIEARACSARRRALLVRRLLTATARTLALTLTLTLPALGALTLAMSATAAAGCGDDSGINDNDAGVDGDADLDAGITDAVVDNGPLDCGVSPADGAVCVTGRLYDFVTREPVMPGEELEVYSFFDGIEQLEARDDPDYVRGRVAPSGRFVVWAHQPPREDDECLALMSTVEGYSPGTVNCYRELNRYPELPGPFQFHLVPQDIYETWAATYPGEADLTRDRPLFLGQCLDVDWAPYTGGSGTFTWSNLTNQFTAECFSLSADRREVFGEKAHCIDEREMPESGASIYFVPFDGYETRDQLEGVSLECNGTYSHGHYYTQELMDSGESSIVIFNHRPR